MIPTPKLLTAFPVLVLVLLLAACAPLPLEIPQSGAATTPIVVTPAAPADATAMTPGIYKGFFPGASSPGLEATLYLNADGTLQLVNDYLNEEPPFVELGTWSEGEGTVEITITGPEDQPYDAPSVRTLAIEEDRLASADWIGPWLRFDALAQGMEPAYEVDLAIKSLDQGFAGYYKRFAPSASCCGQDVTLLLAADNTARLTTNYLNGEAPVQQIGTWTAEEGTVTVSLTGEEGDVLYEAPIVFVLAVEEGKLNAVEYDQSLYGSEGITFYLYPALAMANIDLSDRSVDPEAGSPDAMVGLTWQLQEIQMMDDSVLVPSNPQDYTVQLNADGTVSVQADCNRGQGTYTLNGPELTIENVAYTRALCPEGSLYDRFVQVLEDGHSFVMEEGRMALSFGPDSGIAIFRPVEE